MSVFIPPEWAAHRALWTAWPSDGSLWQENLAPARAEVAAMIRALHAGGERVRVLAAGAEAENAARVALGETAVIIAQAFGDIWLRDTGPIFAKRDGRDAALGFRFNGWGGKYVLDYDDEVAAAIAAKADADFVGHDFVLEGGAIEMDGEGTLLTTRQCLLNPNRNPDWTEAAAEAALREALGIEKILWLDEGLANDHTDGHIDNLARFIAPGIVVCQAPSGDDPNADVLEEIALSLSAMRDAKGRKLEVIRIPSPGAVLSADGEIVPASHMNFVIAAKAVVTPIYSGTGDDALRALQPLFPGRDVIGLSANAILTGGGAFHCITQQEPA
ncbi:MAG: agmatine deiminase family protein [Hyphomonadaceae bacterium]